LLLLVVLLVFFWGRRPETNRRKKIIAFIKSLLEAENRKYFFEKTRWGLFFVGLTLSVVIGLVAAITSAQLVQWRWFRDDTGYTECRSVAVAQATKAVHDLSDTSTTTVTVGELADTALMSGSTRTESTKLGDAFYHAYYDAIGDCRAGDTFKHLWG
jgi:hypothetical protein